MSRLIWITSRLLWCACVYICVCDRERVCLHMCVGMYDMTHSCVTRRIHVCCVRRHLVCVCVFVYVCVCVLSCS